MTIQEILDRLSIPYRLSGQHIHVTTGWIGIDCPQCSPGSGRFRAGINEENLFVNCWTCSGLWLPRVLVDSSGESWELVRELLQGAKSSPGGRSEDSKARGPIIYPPGLEALERPHRAYLGARGFDPLELEEVWGLRGLGPHSLIPWSIFIPVRDETGEEVSWTTRTIGDQEPRYRNAAAAEEKMPIGDLLYGEDLVRGGSIMIVEGPTDAWSIGPGTVAVLGVGVSREQRRRLSTFPVRTICFDADRAGQRRARRLAVELSAFPGETQLVELSTGEDVADADPSEVEELRRMIE